MSIVRPAFVFKHSAYAAILIIALMLISVIFLLMASNLTASDLNKDGVIDWTELFLVWHRPHGLQWVSYAASLGFAMWAAYIVRAVYLFDASKK